jgi:protein-S-isoprenylcysteine O-methyltransferase Ste14
MTIQFFIISVLLILFAHFVFRVVVRNDYLKTARLRPVSYILETLVFALHANAVYLAWPAPWPELPPRPENQLLFTTSSVVFITGMVILVVSFTSLGGKPSFGLDKNKLKTTGLYRYSRNPQLVGYGLMLLSFTVAYFSWPMVIWFALYLIISSFMIRTEEEFLTLKYGDSYKTYREQVPRIFGCQRFRDRKR